MKRSILLFPVAVILLALSVSSCRDAGVRDALVRAEALMESDPHAARAVLDSLNPQSSIFNLQSKDAALYALLRTQADYKCRVRLTSDSLPLIATNYYGTRRKTQHAALAQYYLGCTYSDMGRDLDAIDALLRATMLFPDTTNKYFANSLFELGLLYSNHNMEEEAFSMFNRYRQSEVCYADSTNISFADYNMGLVAMYLNDDTMADSLLLCVIRNTKTPDYFRYDSFFQLAKLYFYHKHEPEKALEYIEKYTGFHKEKGAVALLKAEILSESNKPQLAYESYKKAVNTSVDLYTACSAYKGLSNTAAFLGMPDSTKFYSDQYSVLLDTIYTRNKQGAIAEIKDMHIVEIHDQQLKARHARFMFWMGILAVALLSGTAITFLLIDRKRKKRYLQAQEELRQANVEVLRAQVDEQPADLDALYQKKLAACQKLFRRTPSARLLLVPPASLTAAQRQTLMDDLTRSFVDVMLDVKNASNAVNDQELMYCILSSLQCSTAQMAELLNTTDSTLRKRKARLKEKMPENLYSLFFS